MGIAAGAAIMAAVVLAHPAAATVDERQTQRAEMKVQQTFLDANRAYDEGRLSDAIRLYEGLAEEGHLSSELFFNLGNAYYRNGRTGQAVLNFRRAWYLSPRDPDVVANLRFSLQMASAPAPSLPAFMRPFLKVSEQEWVAAAIVFYWILAAILCALILLRRSRPILGRISIGLAVLLLLSLSGFASWRALRRSPEAVILKSTEALFAPIEGSTAHFALPEGSVVRVEQDSGAWVKVALGRQIGWINSSASRTICSWNGGEKGYGQ